MKIRRLLAAAFVILAAVASMIPTAEAAKPLIFRDHFKGRFADATLVDCPPPPQAADVNCHAAVVGASTDGFIAVSLFDLVVHPDGTFESEFTDFGFTENGTVNIPKKLGTASASGVVALDSGGTLPVSVTWTASGPAQPDSSKTSFKDECFSFREHFKGTFRPATATGTIGGVSMVSPPDAPGVPITGISSVKAHFMEIIRCDPFPEPV